jgi:pyruvate/2-oxoglutarate dehydrogenase complex dihydrolipoamide acyltransferase (E2) component
VSSSPIERRLDEAARHQGRGPDAPGVDSLLVDVSMPQMGVSVAEGTIVAWHKQEGDWVEADETLAEVTTDKIDTEIPSPATGRLLEILVEPGVTVDIGTPLARIATDGRPGEAHVAESEPGPEPDPEPPSHPRRYSPVVQRIAAEHAIDLNAVQGTGRDGRVRKQDVLALVDAAPAAEGPPLHTESPYRPDPVPAPEGQQLSRMRRTIGEHMKRSLETAATCTTWIEVDMGRVERARVQLGVTALPVVGRAVVETLREHPALNAWLEGDRHTVHRDVHLGIAVSLGDDGLIVPVIADAQDLSVEGLGARIRDAAKRARSRALSPDEVRGGTFTITNPGQYGSIMATPVINQPQVAILDLEAIVKRPVVVTGEDGTDAIAIRPITILGLSWDHRALDGAQAAQFLAALKARLEAWPVDKGP